MLVKYSGMYIVVCYYKLSVQQWLCIYTATDLNLKGGSVKTPETHLDPPLSSPFGALTSSHSRH